MVETRKFETAVTVFRLVRPFRWQMAAGLALLAANRLAGLVLPASTKYVVDALLHQPHAPALQLIIAAVAGASVVQAASGWALTRTLGGASQEMIAGLRKQLQRHMLRIGVAEHDHLSSSAMATRIMNDADGLRNLVGSGMVELAGGLLTGAVALGFMLHLDVALTGVLVIVLIAFGCVARVGFRSLRPLSMQRAEMHSGLTGQLAEWLSGIRVIKAFAAEGRGDQVFGEGVERLLSNRLQSVNSIAATQAVTACLVGLSASSVIWVSAREIASGRMTVGGLFSFVAFLGFLLMPMLQVIAITALLSDAVAGVERTESLLGLRREADDRERTLTAPDGPGEIVFENVSFAYAGRVPALEGISFRVPAGTTTAVVGPSGAGKSTIVALLAAFYAPQSGRVLVDGVDIRRVRLESYRSRLGLVTQDAFLLDGSVRENVELGRSAASPEATGAACRTALVSGFAERLPQGYETKVGERGVRLSGGQRQRIALARAVLANPRLLLLDEPTSNLDAESEALVAEAVTASMRGRTTVIVAHRLSTIRNADQILVVEQGCVVERGTHESLMAARGRYFELYRTQVEISGAEMEPAAEAAAVPLATA